MLGTYIFLRDTSRFLLYSESYMFHFSFRLSNKVGSRTLLDYYSGND